MHIHVYQNNQHSYHYHLFLKISSLNGLYYFKHTILREKKLRKKIFFSKKKIQLKNSIKD